MSAPVVITNMLDDTSFRCDACNAQAFYMVALKSTERCPDGELFFCRHHQLEYATALDPLAEFIADESYRLFQGLCDDKHIN
jgi:hypothetical protein